MSYSTVSLFALCVFLICGPSEPCFYNMIHHAVPIPEGESPEAFGKPFFITKHLKGSDAERAKYGCVVENLPNASSEIRALKSFSGFLNVNEVYDSNLFFWFFPQMNGDRNAPLIIWLQGGPGFSSMIGVFAENGPLVYNHKSRNVTMRENTWIRKFNMLYIDSPVGTGFSHTYSEKGYARDQKQITDQLITAMQRFFSVFTEYKTNGIYLAGEGYACKTLFSLADQLHVLDGGSYRLEVNGVIVGNGMCHWGSLTNRSNLLEDVGLIDHFQAKKMSDMSRDIDTLYRMKVAENATESLSALFKDRPSGTSLFRKITSYESLYDYTNAKIPEALYIYTEYLAMIGVRRSLHVGSIPFGNHDTVCQYLIPDLAMQLNQRQLSNVFNNYKVLMYHGRKDALSTYGSFKHFVSEIRWNKAEHAPRRFILYNTDDQKNKTYAGRICQIGEFTVASIWNAGHFVPFDDPKSAHDIVDKFVYGRSFFSY